MGLLYRGRVKVFCGRRHELQFIEAICSETTQLSDTEQFSY